MKDLYIFAVELESLGTLLRPGWRLQGDDSAEYTVFQPSRGLFSSFCLSSIMLPSDLCLTFSIIYCLRTPLGLALICTLHSFCSTPRILGSVQSSDKKVKAILNRAAKTSFCPASHLGLFSLFIYFN